jgi:hypothetical protein
MAQRTARAARRTTTRRSAVPPTASLGQMFAKLTGASTKLAKSRRRVRGW